MGRPPRPVYAIRGFLRRRAGGPRRGARLGGALSKMVTVRLIVGDFAGAIAAGRQALELAATLGDPALQAETSFRVGQAYATIGDYSQAAEVLLGNVEALVRSTPGLMRALCIKSQARLAQY